MNHYEYSKQEKHLCVVTMQRITMFCKDDEDVQKLNPNDYTERNEFANLIGEIELNDNYANRLIFSDEALFLLNGDVLPHNVRYWSKL